jgi:hypothetical protein
MSAIDLLMVYFILHIVTLQIGFHFFSFQMGNCTLTQQFRSLVVKENSHAKSSTEDQNPKLDWKYFSNGPDGKLRH